LEGWEALARDPETKLSPQALFSASELWGVQFMAELDLYFLNKAVNIYHQECSRLNLQRANEIIPLAVNVYPDSLMLEAYLNAVLELIRSGRIPKDKLILEISEKLALPQPTSWNEDKPSSNSFKIRLRDYVRKGAKVKFAIDDFGVGHASISRLVGLGLNYVKIDREILNYPPEVRDGIISFVHNALVDSDHSPRIVLEGVDSDYPLDIEHCLKVDAFIQGFAVDKAVESIYKSLPRERYKSINDKLARSSRTGELRD
jgi:EAL domain-containing protein (putative c-di-GMP-specific phosphodiesterase class I)